MEIFIFLAAIASKYFLRKEKRIKKWIPNLFLIAGSILFLASILAMCENIPFLEGVLNGLFGKMFTDSQLFAAYFYSQWVVAVLLLICGIAFLLSLKKFKEENWGWDKSPSLSIVFGLSSKTQWLSWLYYADFISFCSPTQLCGGGTTKSNSNELPISVPLSFTYLLGWKP